ncbi:hypothetical protein WN55_08717 [Dufourea novaeangliae]|uniref:Circadian clock-controlled protein n=1 Tax=Dufourea novaeangliae TaxID=178035 RepID=A0A154P1V3_DUFNO|nr:hypothetical protein WN55_08717 [Dufourea novaeangliae]
MMTRRAPSGGKLFSLIDAMFICCVVATVFIVSSQHSTKYVAKYFEQAESIYEEHRFEDEEEELQTDLTELINTFLPLVSKLIVAYELDPLEISDVRQNYSIRFASLPVAYGVLTYSFSSGLLHHLSDLERVDTAIGTFRDNTLSIDASLEMDSMLMSYDYFVKVLFLRQYGTILAEANSILVNVRIDIDTIDCTFVLKKLKLHRIQANNDGDDRLSVNIDELLDSILPTLQDLILKQGLDPLKMDDFSHNLKGIISHDGVFQLTNGWLQGLSVIKRAGNAILSYGDRRLTVDAMLNLEVLDMNYHYLLKYSLISRKGEFRGRFQNMKIRVVLSLDTQNYKLVVDSLRVTGVEKMTVKLEGNVIDPILNQVLKSVVKSFRNDVINMIEQQCLPIFQSLVNRINDKIPRPDRPMAEYSNENLEDIPTVIEFLLV